MKMVDEILALRRAAKEVHGALLGVRLDASAYRALAREIDAQFPNTCFATNPARIRIMDVDVEVTS